MRLCFHYILSCLSVSFSSWSRAPPPSFSPSALAFFRKVLLLEICSTQNQQPLLLVTGSLFLALVLVIYTHCCSCRLSPLSLLVSQCSLLSMSMVCALLHSLRLSSRALVSALVSVHLDGPETTEGLTQVDSRVLAELHRHAACKA